MADRTGGVGRRALHVDLTRWRAARCSPSCCSGRRRWRCNGFVADHGWMPPTLERLFPFLLGMPVATFILCAIILDCAEYWRHRLSHMFR